ncbi:succinate dehydrogenase cytochrome b subunit [Rubellicoccus peritrichatus]|uniref:Succinate dehydrogenase cytochrome b subunit n=1 Tax=Rubellicoccus peritrichatus TaxID=3080537 RepID=A0AAQ3LCY9_9BACT|nr:succinate dehydrogenase cytochrome b subunit [Puniceicoccus sp. CR14]WOO41620.1 succinate dehydrogenase cytochrome b subunit [Puniceicoccus sp. CR14]
MSEARKVVISSLTKKYLMAGSGLFLVLFILGHMLGNLQFFLGPDVINSYAYHLHHLPGHPFSLWAIRLVLLGCLAVHVWMAILLTTENKRARGPDAYAQKHSNVATYAARTMPVTGVVILAFIVLHILQFTTRVVPEDYNKTIGEASIEVAHVQIQAFDVFAMMVDGFSEPLFSIIYIVAVALLCMHLSHGVASMFQSFGFRNEIWRKRLNVIAHGFGWIIFLGFASIPASVMVFGFGKSYLAEMEQKWASQPPLVSTAAVADNKSH